MDVHVRLPRYLVDALDARARADCLDRSSLVRTILLAEQRRTVPPPELRHG